MSTRWTSPAVRPDAPTERAARVAHLRARVDEAYALARSEVFDREPLGAHPAGRTAYQQRLVAKLEAAEEELRQARLGLPALPLAGTAAARPGVVVPSPRTSLETTAGSPV